MTYSIASRLQILVNQSYEGKWSKLARAAGISPTTLQQIKDGSDPKASTLLRIAESAGVSLVWLLTGHGPIFEKKAVNLDEAPKEQMKKWIDTFWLTASEKERHWLEMEFEINFPQYKEWLQKNQVGNMGSNARSRLEAR